MSTVAEKLNALAMCLNQLAAEAFPHGSPTYPQVAFRCRICRAEASTWESVIHNGSCYAIVLIPLIEEIHAEIEADQLQEEAKT